MYNIVNNQRFKEVPNLGKWLENGRRGEYYLLGRGYSGQTIANVYFPVDGTPETTPDKWNYITINGASGSWSDTSKYKYIEQLEYMKNSKLLFDTIDYSNNTCNSYNLIEYDITPKSIGLGKTILNTCSTWKTYGVITINRLNAWGQKRYATMAVAPMAASADVKSKFDYYGNTKISGTEDSINLNLNFSANAINLTNYATEKQIKEITSILYINNKEIARVSGSKTVFVDKNISYTVSRNMFSSPGENKIHIKVVSYLYTEFSVDGLMQDTLEKDILINVDEKLVVPIKSSDIYVQKKINNKLVVSPLVQTVVTNNKSEGFIEKNRLAAIKLNLNEGIENINNIVIKINNKKVQHNILYKDSKKYILGFSISKDIQNTLATWDYLRDKSNNYFEIKFSEIGKRIREPIKVDIEFLMNGKEHKENLKIDVVDEYEKNINFIFENGVINKQEIEKNYELKEV